MTYLLSALRPRRVAAMLAVAAVAMGLLGAASTASASVTYDKVSYVQSGDWRTLATLWNTTATGRFVCPANAQIRIRYGAGYWWTGAYNEQTQTLNCWNYKYLVVSKLKSLEGARMQIKVPTSTYVSWSHN